MDGLFGMECIVKDFVFVVDFCFWCIDVFWGFDIFYEDVFVEIYDFFGEIVNGEYYLVLEKILFVL